MSDPIANARIEIVERIKQRDLTLSLFGTAFAVILGLAVDKGQLILLLAVPGLALTFALLAVYHDNHIQFQHRYLKRRSEPDSWDNSPEHAEYGKSWTRWTYFFAQALAFGGSSCLSVVLNRGLASARPSALGILWLLDCVLAATTVILLVWIRWTRHRTGKLLTQGEGGSTRVADPSNDVVSPKSELPPNRL